MPISISGNGTITGVTPGGLPDGSVTTDEIANGAVTAAKMASAVQPLGVGQTWQNVLASRALDVVYTNTTGRPICVVVCAGRGGSSASATARLEVGEVVIASQTVAESNGSGWNSTPAGFSAIVPDNTTYKMVNVSNAALTSWVELR